MKIEYCKLQLWNLRKTKERQLQVACENLVKISQSVFALLTFDQSSLKFTDPLVLFTCCQENKEFFGYKCKYFHFKAIFYVIFGIFKHRSITPWQKSRKLSTASNLVGNWRHFGKEWFSVVIFCPKLDNSNGEWEGSGSWVNIWTERTVRPISKSFKTKGANSGSFSTLPLELHGDTKQFWKGHTVSRFYFIILSCYR